MAAKSIEIRCIFIKEKWRSDNGEGDFMIGIARPVEQQPASGGDATAHSNGKPKPIRVSLSRPVNRFQQHEDEFTIKGNCEPGELQSLMEFRLFGHWEENEQYGPQFIFKTFVLARPHTQAGIVRYLSEAGKGCGFGPAMAQQLFTRFAGDSVRILREQPDVAAAAVPRLNVAVAEKVAERLEVLASTEDCSIELMDLLHGRGFPKKTAQEALRIWGNQAKEKIEQNPYRLMRFSGCGFLRCDSMYLDLGLPAEKMRRQVICAWHCCTSDTEGNTWISADKAREFLRSKVSGAAVNFDKALAIASRFGAITLRHDKSCQRCGGVGEIGVPDLFDGSTFDEFEPCPMCNGRGGKLWIADAKRAKAERYVAEKVAEMLAWPHSWPAVEGEAFSGLSDHQATELRKSLSGAIGSLGGGPGTGKTHSLAALVKLLISTFGDGCVGICSPTGKAAIRCTEAMREHGISKDASTIHRLLGVEAGGSDGWSFRHGPDNPLDFRFVVVDEVSMVGIPLFASLLSAIGKGTCLLLIGDRGQLLPIEHGAPLRDLIGHIPYGELTEIHRNSGGIVQVCKAIRSGSLPEFPESLDLDAEPPKNIRIAKAIQSNAADCIIQQVQDYVHNGVIDPAWDVQVCVAVNQKSPLSREALNEKLQGILNPSGQPIGIGGFKIGDKVIVKQNGTYKRYKTESSAKSKDAIYTIDVLGHVYGLYDKAWPDKILYVGYTLQSLPRRLRQHIAKSVNRKIDAYLSRFAIRDVLGIKLLEDVRPGFNPEEAEKRWIAALRSEGHDLLNVRSGGQSCKQPHSRTYVPQERTIAEEVSAFNGELGRIICSKSGEKSGKVGVELTCPYRFIEINNSNVSLIDLAYAISAHKMQGSSAKVVIVALDEYPGATGPFGICSREWIYTAISRAETACILVGQEETARKMCRRVAIGKRKTFLSESLNEFVGRSRSRQDVRSLSMHKASIGIPQESQVG